MLEDGAWVGILDELLPRGGDEAPAARCLYLLYLAADDEMLREDRHRFRVLTRLPRARLECRAHFGLHRRLGVRNQPVAVHPGEVHTLRSLSGDVERGWLRRHIVEPRALDLVIPPIVRHPLARPQFADHRDRFHEAVGALLVVAPLAARRHLVERLARADAEEDAPRIEDAERRERLREMTGLYRNVGQVTPVPKGMRGTR